MSCPGPTGDQWMCDGRACTVGGMHTTCRIAKEQEGYIFTYTKRAQLAEEAYKQAKKMRSSNAHKS